ncbi:LysM peptidoglycan-binding domain-containing protein, partial [Streptomyces sp. 12297]
TPAPGEGTGRHRGAAAEEGAGSTGTPSGIETQTVDPTYTVQPGDSLSEIANVKGVKGGWNALYEANERLIGEDADLIQPGQNLDLRQK